MSKIIFTERAWDEYLYWHAQDRHLLKRIHALIKDIERNVNNGIGKPEPLRYQDGLWSRRIDDCHRLVYRLHNEQIEIIQCKGHYDD